MTFSASFLDESIEILHKLDPADVEALVSGLAAVRSGGGRLFILGVGGSAGHASHAVNDFRKLCAFEAYAPTDNVSELSARINDDGWDSAFSKWLEGSHLRSGDALLIFSVGGGTLAPPVSTIIVEAIKLAETVGAAVFGIVGRDGGYTASHATVAVVIPPLFPNHVTPHTEGLAAVLWHLVVTHPALAASAAKWESVV